jgi:type IV pilus assembly protein PilM
MAILNRLKKNVSRVGLDIGNRSLKLVEIKELKGELHLTAIGVKELPSGVIDSGDIKDKNAFIDAVTTLVDQCDPNIIDVVISLGGQGILSDKFNVKIDPSENVEETILWEASQRSPFDVEDITLSYKILRQFPEKNEVEVLLVAAKNFIMQNYIDTLYEAGLRPVVVDVDTYAFNNCYAMESVAEATLDTLVLIDIGYVGCRVIFVKNGLYHSSREITTAGDFFIKTLQKQLKVPEQDAQALLQGRELPNVLQEDFDSSLSYALEEFGSSFDMAFSYLKKTEDVDSVDKVVLCGGGAYIPNILPFLSDRMDAEVVRSNPFNFLRYDPGLFRDINPEQISALLTVAVGLALRKVD